MNWIPGNTKQGTFTIVIVILLLVCIRVGFYINEPAEYFSGNLLPELTGMLIELCIILFIVDRWQEKNRIQLLIVKEKRLREYLIFFLRHGFKTLPRKYRVGNFYGEEHKQNIEYLDNLFDFIKANGLATQEIDAIRSQCDIDLNTFGNLLPVASELTDDHFKAWSRIVYFMVRISKGLGDDEESIKYIITNIKRYESASHASGIYVGSKSV
ncbi:hypothetical protein NB532_18210 [Vibrio antiquarius]|uniref:hypothetical protein n=1 Tax=Vibrio antiquarius (strain Ex25) TaxID=150340 RepID=UPI0026589D46|nr:hypothetical protein [Vibrio antiquarius]MCR9478325.1 hypothetical protein [Vibrio antiquarius]